MGKNETKPAAPRRKRTGCLYSEIQRNTGRGNGELYAGAFRRGVGYVDASRLRWVAEIHYHGVRYRFRSTNYANVRFWLDCMVLRFND